MLKLLLVDDDEEELELFSAAVNEIRKDVDVLHEDGCSDLVKSIADGQPDIVFLDINLPTTDGIHCLRTIRSEKAFQSLPVIMYSTSSNKLSIRQSFENKANLYVVKPYSYERLLAILQEVLSTDWRQQQPREFSKFLIT